MIQSTPGPWRGFIDGKPVELTLDEVRERFGNSYPATWSIQLGPHGEVSRLSHDGRIRLAMSAEVAQERKWQDVAALFHRAKMSP